MKRKRRKKLLISFAIIICIVGFVFFIYDALQIGKELDSYKGVAVHYNGIIFVQSHGKNYSDSGYYYGYKWQCVEFVKRFFYEVKKHEMPDGFGNARDFFDPSVEQGQLNQSRGLIQYYNGDDVSPQPDDLLVFNDTKYGHMAIIAEVADSYIDIIQQNKPGKVRERLPLHVENGKYYVGIIRKPAGWLRAP